MNQTIYYWLSEKDIEKLEKEDSFERRYEILEKMFFDELEARNREKENFLAPKRGLFYFLKERKRWYTLGTLTREKYNKFKQKET